MTSLAQKLVMNLTFLGVKVRRGDEGVDGGEVDVGVAVGEVDFQQLDDL